MVPGMSEFFGAHSLRVALDARSKAVVIVSMRTVGGILMALAAAAMFIFIEDVVVAVPIALLVVGITLIATDARARRN